MSPNTRRALALIVAGTVAGGVVVLIDRLAQKSVAMTGGGNLTAGQELKAAMEAGRIPFNTLLLVLGGWLVASYVGSTMARRLSGERGPALIFASLFTLVVLKTLAEAPHPGWMWAGGLLGVPLIALGALGERITVRTR